MAVPLPSPQMAWQTIDDEVVLLDVDGKQLMGVNEVGARTWALMDGVRTIDDIARVLSEEFDVPADIATADVHTFVEELRKLGAVVLV